MFPGIPRRAAGVVVLVLVFGAAFVGAAIRPLNLAGPARVVFIPAGAPSSTIGQLLYTAGIVRSASYFVATVKLRGLTHSLQGGEYRLSPAMTLLEVVDVI